MRIPDNDRALLWDMLDAARAIQEFINEMTMSQFIGDQKDQKCR